MVFDCAGNEAVLRARFEDALFFYESDLKRKLEEYKPSLANIAFQKDLGSMLDKTSRVENIIPSLAELCSLTGELAEGTGCDVLQCFWTDKPLNIPLHGGD